MASANVELVWLIYAGLERGDYSAADWADPEIEFVIADGPAAGRWIGRKAMADAWRDFLSAWEQARTEVEEYRELDGERVLVLEHFTARGKTSGVDVGQLWQKGAALFQISGDRVIRLVVYWDHECALADLGLAPEQ
jgi:ketosteroid isomerase-like protein